MTGKSAKAAGCSSLSGFLFYSSFFHINFTLRQRHFFKRKKRLWRSYKKTAHPPSTASPSRDSGSQLKTDDSAAHIAFYLLLLPSGPDRVHSATLHRIHFSAPLSNSIHRKRMPGEGIQPCWSGLQVQGTANSPPSAVFILYSVCARIATPLCSGRENFRLSKCTRRLCCPL